MSNMTKEKGRQWDGKSRVSNETYRQNWNDIFKKEKTLHEELGKTQMEGFNKEQHGTTEETDGTTD
jgi:hypothetical protein